MIKAILFDFNGVIIDDERIQLTVYQEVLREEEIILTEEDYFASLGMNDLIFVRAAFERAGKAITDDKLQDVINRKTAAHRRIIENELPLFAGVVTFIKAASRRFSLGLVSMARREEIAYVLDRAGLARYFDVIVSAEDIKTYKPDPGCYLLGLSLLNEKRSKDGAQKLSSKECLAIEDAPPGIEAARAAGMRSLGVTNTVLAEQLRAAHADVVTKNLFDWTVDAVHHVFADGIS